jgi:hypothetical protein
MTLGILTTLWKRHAIAQIVLDHYAHLDLSPVRSVRLAVGSEGDVSRSLAEQAGWEYLEHGNLPLSDKWNAGMAALRNRVDAVLIVGSDDIMTAKAIQLSLSHIDLGADVVGLKDLYYYDTRNKQAYYGERHNPGAGMIATSNVLDRVNWQPWDLGLNRYLDRSFTNRMQTKAYPCKFKYISKCREQAADLVDIKTDTNMWSVEQLAEATGRIYSVDSSVFENTFPDLRDKLNQQDNG